MVNSVSLEPTTQDKPLSRHEELFRVLRERILSGEIGEGERFPTIRQLASQYEVSPVTISKSIGLLKDSGLVDAISGSGIYVARVRPEASLKNIVTFFVDYEYSFAAISSQDSVTREYLMCLLSEILQGVQDEAGFLSFNNNTIHLKQSVLLDRAELTKQVRQYAKDADGVVFIWTEMTQDLADTLKSVLDVPIVLTDLPIGSINGHNVVRWDLYPSACSIVQHLIDLGHTRIGCMGGDPKYYPARYRAYHDVLKQNGLKPIDELNLQTGETLESIQEASQRFLKMPADQRPTAIFFHNDLRAYIFMKQAAQMGLRFPQDIALAGCDGSPDAIREGLTTIQVPLRQMGRSAVMMLRSLVSGQLYPPAIFTISAGMIQGKTT